MNRALNQSMAFLDRLPNEGFAQTDLNVIDWTFERIPAWKRRLDYLDMEIDRLLEGIGTLPQGEFDVFANDFRATMDEINTSMEALGHVLIRHRH